MSKFVGISAVENILYGVQREQRIYFVISAASLMHHMFLESLTKKYNKNIILQKKCCMKSVRCEGWNVVIIDWWELHQLWCPLRAQCKCFSSFAHVLTDWFYKFFFVADIFPYLYNAIFINFVQFFPRFKVIISWKYILKGIVSRDFGSLFLISLDRFEGRNRAWSGLFFFLMTFSCLNFKNLCL
jgi:hypothetical protein